MAGFCPGYPVPRESRTAALRDHVMPDGTSQDTRYGTTWQDGDLVRIPEADLPPGSPSWWLDLAAWASRTGADMQTKRATVSVVVPRAARTWPVLPDESGA